MTSCGISSSKLAVLEFIFTYGEKLLDFTSTLLLDALFNQYYSQATEYGWFHNVIKS